MVYKVLIGGLQVASYSHSFQNLHTKGCKRGNFEPQCLVHFFTKYKKQTLYLEIHLEDFKEPMLIF
jgi:hypothetical protein